MSSSVLSIIDNHRTTRGLRRTLYRLSLYFVSKNAIDFSTDHGIPWQDAYSVFKDLPPLLCLPRPCPVDVYFRTCVNSLGFDILCKSVLSMFRLSYTFFIRSCLGHLLTPPKDPISETCIVLFLFSICRPQLIPLGQYKDHHNCAELLIFSLGVPYAKKYN